MQGYIEQGRKLFAFNQTIPFTPENIEATKALFGENLGEGQRVPMTEEAYDHHGTMSRERPAEVRRTS